MTWCNRISPTDGSSACWPTGAHPSPATTFTIRAAANRRRPSPWWSRRCVIGAEGAPVLQRTFDLLSYLRLMNDLGLLLDRLDRHPDLARHIESLCARLDPAQDDDAG